MTKINFPDSFSHQFFLFLAVLNIIASSLYFGSTHFTWWSFQVFLLLLLAGAFDVLSTQLCTFCLYNSLFVMIGVFVMSIIGTDDAMLVKTAATTGLGIYGLQTFIVQ